MIDLQQIVKQLEEVFEPAQAEKVALTLYEMAHSLYERQLLAHIDALSAQLRQFEQRMTERFDALAEQTQRNTEAIAQLAEQTQRNTEAIAVLTEQVQRLTEAVERHEAILARHGELIEENRHAIRSLRESMEQMRQHFTERIDALQASMEQMRQHFTERIDALQVSMEQMRQHFTERIDALQASMEQMRRHFTRRNDDLAKQIGGLAITVGYILENEAYKALPALLQRDYGLEVIGRLKRGYAVDAEGNEYEVNILGEARQNGRRLTIVGESKAQLSKQEIDRFVRRKLKPLQRIYGEVFPIIVTHMTSSRGVEEYARQQGIAVYYSYDF